MKYVWLVCLLVGLLLPILSMVLEFFDTIFETDFDLSIDMDFDFFPTSIKAICIGLFMYGSLGLIVHHISHSIVISNVIGGVIGYLTAVAVQNVMHYLKRNESYANSKDVVLFSYGEVLNKIPENGLGVVKIEVPNDGIKTLTAREKNNQALEQGEKIQVIAIEDTKVVVERA